jgi:2-hydroxycyclohexanecarboxyl-CoA dehydrogenase
VDVTSHAAVEAAVASVLERRERIDVLVNCAGWDFIAPFIETGPDIWDRIMAINFRGLLSFVRAVLPGMTERHAGRIVNVASDAGRAGSSGEAVYSGAKGAIIAFTKSLAREVARSGIRVNCVAPGLTETPLLNEVRQGHERLMDAIVRATPLGRTAQPAEIAAAILFFAGPDSSFVTGQTLSVSGGLTMM